MKLGRNIIPFKDAHTYSSQCSTLATPAYNHMN